MLYKSKRSEGAQSDTAHPQKKVNANRRWMDPGVCSQWPPRHAKPPTLASFPIAVAHHQRRIRCGRNVPYDVPLRGFLSLHSSGSARHGRSPTDNRRLPMPLFAITPGCLLPVQSLAPFNSSHEICSATHLAEASIAEFQACTCRVC